MRAEVRLAACADVGVGRGIGGEVGVLAAVDGDGAAEVGVGGAGVEVGEGAGVEVGVGRDGSEVGKGARAEVGVGVGGSEVGEGEGVEVGAGAGAEVGSGRGAEVGGGMMGLEGSEVGEGATGAEVGLTASEVGDSVGGRVGGAVEGGVAGATVDSPLLLLSCSSCRWGKAAVEGEDEDRSRRARTQHRRRRVMVGVDGRGGGSGTGWWGLPGFTEGRMGMGRITGVMVRVLTSWHVECTRGGGEASAVVQGRAALRVGDEADWGRVGHPALQTAQLRSAPDSLASLLCPAISRRPHTADRSAFTSQICSPFSAHCVRMTISSHLIASHLISSHLCLSNAVA